MESSRRGPRVFPEKAQEPLGSFTFIQKIQNMMGFYSHAQDLGHTYAPVSDSAMVVPIIVT